MADECHGALDLPTESLDFTHGFSWTLHLGDKLGRGPMRIRFADAIESLYAEVKV